MTAKNDITGDAIRSKPSRAYSDNWEKIFGNSNQQIAAQNSQNVVEAIKGRGKKK